jgi:threonine dehydrogenase-like Zn-dependent dehydrogenase
MKALLLWGDSRATAGEWPDPATGPGELLVEVRASAMCGSERRTYAKPADAMGAARPVLSGHEMAGVVRDPGSSACFKAGDPVCFYAFASCGACAFCRAGQNHLCASRRFVSGTHAQLIAVPASCCLALPADIPFDIAALLGGDTLGVACRAANQLAIAPGDPVLVSGAGPVGLGVALLFRHLGADIAVSDPSAYRRAFALERAGAGRAFDPLDADYRESVLAWSGGGPLICAECSGNPGAQLLALQLTRCQGHVVFCGENYAGLTIVPSDHIIHREITLHGAFYFAAANYRQILAYYRQGLDPSPLISHHVSLEQGPEAMARFMRGETGKVIVEPWR